MLKANKKGFTLIELLVVIAIIGILASIVLAALNQARNKGSDAAIKGDLVGVRVQAALYYDTNQNFGASAVNGTCPGASGNTVFSDSTIQKVITALGSGAGNLNASPVCYVDASGTNWAMSATLKTSGYWCVDGTGASKAETAALTATTCP